MNMQGILLEEDRVEADGSPEIVSISGAVDIKDLS